MTPRVAAAPSDLVVFAGGSARFLGRRFVCALGRGGLSDDKCEGDRAAPRGAFRIEEGFYRADRLVPPASRLALRPIGPFDGWSDDPTDAAYNAPVRWPHAHSAERLMRADPLYDLVLAPDINRDPATPGAGSAIFLHVWRGPRKPTAGCVAFARADLLWIAGRWTTRSRLILW